MNKKTKIRFGICCSFVVLSSFMLMRPEKLVYKKQLSKTFGINKQLATTPNMQAENTIQQNSNLITPGAKLELISKQFRFTEGPATDKNGNVFFTDQPNDKIWKYSTDEKLSVFMEKSGRANGLYFDNKGNLLACADEHNQIWSITPQGKVTVLLKNYQGQLLNGPNDLWMHPQTNNIYFTDPYYQRDYWERKNPDIKGEKVYLLAKGKTEPIVIDDQLKQPNGIIGTPDGKTLYVADIGDNKTYKYDISADGKLTNRRLFVSQGSDGMTIDNQGNIYLTGKGVTIYNAAGEKIEHIPVSANWTGNVTFGGKDRNILFITASESVYTLAMQVKGV